MYLKVMQAIVRAVERGKVGVVCTVLDHKGSSPGKRHHKMLVLEDGTRVGTIGGGTMEAQVLELVPEIIATGRGRHVSLLIAEKGEGATGGVCGGRAEISLELLPTVPRILLCGAGHCSVELGRSIDQLGYAYEVHDDRPELLDPEAFPGARKMHRGDPGEVCATIDGHDRFSHVLLVSRGHATDRIYAVALARAGYDRWIGMLGSKRKAKLMRRTFLEEDELDVEWVERLECPVGLKIGASSPAEIAYSIMGRIVETVRRS